MKNKIYIAAVIIAAVFLCIGCETEERDYNGSNTNGGGGGGGDGGGSGSGWTDFTEPQMLAMTSTDSGASIGKNGSGYKVAAIPHGAAFDCFYFTYDKTFKEIAMSVTLPSGNRINRIITYLEEAPDLNTTWYPSYDTNEEAPKIFTGTINISFNLGAKPAQKSVVLYLYWSNPSDSTSYEFTINSLKIK